MALRDPNWLGIGGLITGIGVAISGFAYMKVQQSKIEENNNNETQENK